MRRIRVIPVLLVSNGKLVKTTKFKNEVYVGDPINAIKIFNDKEVDELVVLDITATKDKRSPKIPFINNIASECFMPLAYGGGITKVDHIKEVLNIGVEKVIINTAAQDFSLLSEGAKIFGSQSIVVSIDVKQNLFGKNVVYTHGGKNKLSIPLETYVSNLVDAGAGELIINSINHDGLMEGYNHELIKKVTSLVSIPVVACGGANSITDFKTAIKDSNASAVAAGAMFVFKGKHRAVLINYPKQEELINSLYKQVV